MDEFKGCDLDYFPENILIDVLSFLSVRELVRAGRVCKRWKRLVKDQRLWRTVDLTAWKGVTSRILWVLLRQYFGCGLRCLRLRGLLLSARGGTFLSESWLKALSTKCPRLNQHLQSLASWERLCRLELRDTFRITANGLRSCAAKDGLSGMEGLSKLKFLELGITARQGYQLQMASLGLGAGWLGLEELSLGGKEVGPGLLCASRLKDLKRLCLWACTLGELQIVRSCRMLRGLRQLQFEDVVFQPRQSPPAEEEERSNEEQQDGEEHSEMDNNDDNKTQDTNDPFPSLRRSLAVMLPSCSLVFTNCSVQINAD
uniref:F-box domain-containing protein n=1 Tax=Oryzias latipes TaxID=8090 RepID=A0A3P9I206_ORYLA